MAVGDVVLWTSTNTGSTFNCQPTSGVEVMVTTAIPSYYNSSNYAWLYPSHSQNHYIVGNGTSTGRSSSNWLATGLNNCNIKVPIKNSDYIKGYGTGSYRAYFVSGIQTK